MMRLLIALLVLTGCAKSAATKQAETDLCRLKYGTNEIATCLTAEYGWDPADAIVAERKRINQEQR